MLVLTRKQNEKIRIGDSIVITVVRMKGNAVRLGIEAPKEVNILRGELVFGTSAENVNGKAEAVVKESVEQSSEGRSPRNKTAKVRVNGTHRNPASQWSGERREDRGGPSWPTALLDTIL